MKTKVGDILTKLECMRNLMCRIEDNQPIDNYLDYIHEILEEYSDLLMNTKVEI